MISANWSAKHQSKQEQVDMPEMSSGTALRQIQQAQAGLRKARQLLKESRGDANPDRIAAMVRVGWAALAHCHKMLAEIPLAAASEAVMTKQLAAQRYATALLVRLRRLARNETGVTEDLDDEDDHAFEDPDS